MLRVGLMFLGLGLAACSSSKPPVCKNTTAKTCVSYTGTAYGDSDLQISLKARCTAVSGSSFTAAGECQTGALLGSCTRNRGQAFEQVDRHFVGAVKTAAQIESECVSEGALFGF